MILVKSGRVKDILLGTLKPWQSQLKPGLELSFSFVFFCFFFNVLLQKKYNPYHDASCCHDNKTVTMLALTPVPYLWLSLPCFRHSTHSLPQRQRPSKCVVRLKRVEETVSHEHRELLNVTMKIPLKMVLLLGCPSGRAKSASGNAQGPDTPGCTLML